MDRVGGGRREEKKWVETTQRGGAGRREKKGMGRSRIWGEKGGGREEDLDRELGRKTTGRAKREGCGEEAARRKGNAKKQHREWEKRKGKETVGREDGK